MPNVIGKTVSNDIALGVLLSALATNPDLPLVFRCDGRDLKPGYHVTEVKSGRFDALDCVANPESWTEIFIQPWDADEDGRTHMPAAKFSAIVRKVSEHVGLPKTAHLTFEVSDGVAPMALYCAATPLVQDGQVRIELSPRAASCKPRDRCLEEQARTSSSCCGKTSACCV
ncbi:hypothetical protein GOA81_28150 [Sinorhizobium meliloti]|uniref:DUF6428 family protein n=1 Tax=Rhizobium meliloti TaxID=382 RepID=UPI00299EEE79|nr:hypothetical protein [Sinorhizobium meliloti]MDW9800846.1 hypothetical protein [Sinorhizobium meliloti]